ncbi:MAG: hypothetical protein II881_09195 [Oscillospiraceae bacterium]|nr:hypothetical protein [Oscillospiraceae bacterium]
MAKLPLIIRFLGKLVLGRKNPPLPALPQKGRWYRVNMPGHVASDGSEYGFDMRFGSENRLIVYLHGGGMSWDEHMAAHPSSLDGDTDDMYYTPRAGHCKGTKGLFSLGKENPFRNWSIISLPYCTGDFHCGRADFPYTASDGIRKTLYHHGYDNTVDAIAEAVRHLPTPEKLMICGNSAGGFGASFMADTIIDLFPECGDITVYNDSAFFIRKDWVHIVRDVWNAPEAVWNNVKTENAVLDSLLALKEKRPQVKLMFSCSTRDYNISIIEGYDEVGKLIPKREYGDHMERNLAAMCDGLADAGIFIFDIPASGREGELGFTKHCIAIDSEAAAAAVDGANTLQWLWDGVNGRQKKYGLDKLGETN